METYESREEKYYPQEYDSVQQVVMVLSCSNKN